MGLIPIPIRHLTPNESNPYPNRLPPSKRDFQPIKVRKRFQRASSDFTCDQLSLLQTYRISLPVGIPLPGS